MKYLWGVFPLLALLAVSCASAPPQAVKALDPAVVKKGWDAYLAVFFDPSGDSFFKDETRGKYTDFWIEAQNWDTVMDYYVLTKDPAILAMAEKEFAAFAEGEEVPIWAGNEFNDDIMWWVIACDRAYGLTGKAAYLETARKNFDLVYERGFDTVLGGGIYWKTDKQEKNSCINCPAVIAAVRLARDLKDPSYLQKAVGLYTWVQKTLTDGNGTVYDNLNIAGKRSSRVYTYNQGTYLGASLELYKATSDAQYLAEAEKAALQARVQLTDKDVLVNEGTGDGAAFKGIFVRYLRELASWTGGETLRGWLTKNATVAWSHRRDDGIIGENWAGNPGNETLQSGAAATSVALLISAKLAESPLWEGQGPVPDIGASLGAAQKSVASKKGVEKKSDFSRVQAASFKKKSDAVVAEACSEGGKSLGGITDGTMAVYKAVNLKAGAKGLWARVASATEGGQIEVHLDAEDGPLVGTCDVPGTGGWQKWETVECPVEHASGVHDVYLLFKGNSYLFNLHWFQFF